MLVAEQLLGPYRLIGRVGAGGMGEVWKAEDTRLGRVVAIKVLPPAVVADHEAIARLKREARTAAQLYHPNIATIHSIEEIDGLLFIVMEFVDGRPLTDAIRSGELSEGDICRIGRGVAGALTEAHEQGIIHRDIKPDNIVVRGQRVKVLDFGIAKRMESEAGSRGAAPTFVTQQGFVIGTVQYMSPEQALGKSLDSRTDIFSLGVVLYEAATGRLPFAGETTTETMTQIIRDDPATASVANPSVSAGLNDIIMRCLRKNREERFASAALLATALESQFGAAKTGPISASVRRESPVNTPTSDQPTLIGTPPATPRPESSSGLSVRPERTGPVKGATVPAASSDVPPLPAIAHDHPTEITPPAFPAAGQSTEIAGAILPAASVQSGANTVSSTLNSSLPTTLAPPRSNTSSHGTAGAARTLPACAEEEAGGRAAVTVRERAQPPEGASVAKMRSGPAMLIGLAALTIAGGVAGYFAIWRPAADRVSAPAATTSAASIAEPSATTVTVTSEQNSTLLPASDRATTPDAATGDPAGRPERGEVAGNGDPGSSGHRVLPADGPQSDELSGDEESASQPAEEREIRAARANPEEADALYDQAMAKIAAGLWMESRALLEAVIRTEPRHARAHLRLGEIAMLTRALDSGADHFQQAISSSSKLDDRERVLARLGLAVCTGDFDGARAAALELGQQNPRDPELLRIKRAFPAIFGGMMPRRAGPFRRH